MDLLAVELRRLRLPLVAPFRTSFGTQTSREVVLVHAMAQDAEGWAECVALEEPTYSSEYIEAAMHVLRHHILPRVFSEPDVDAGRIARVLEPVRGHRMAKAAVETAVLDAELRLRNEPLSAFLGATNDRVPAGVSVGIMDSVPKLIAAVEGYLSEGYKRIKLKIEPGWDVVPVGAIRQRFGDDLLLQVDANAAYTLADTPVFEILDSFDLVLVEQPLSEEDLLGHAQLARRIKTPICLDESIKSAADAATAIALGACSVVNIKPGRVGGYLEARRIHDLCAEHGVPVWCGGMLETGIGRAANLALAALPNFLLPGDTSASSRYYCLDVTAPFVLEDGHVRVPDGAGIGVAPIPEALDELTTSTEVLTPSSCGQ